MQILNKEALEEQIRELEADLTVGNYFQRIETINKLKEELAEITRA